MKSSEIVQLILSVVAIILIPLLAFVVRELLRSARVEAKLDSAIQDIAELVKNKDQVHAAMLDQMKYDREATNKRLRWLEQYVWRTAGAKLPPPLPDSEDVA